MIWSRIILVAGLAVSTLSSALPDGGDSVGFFDFLTKRTVSPDETCGDVSNGDNNGYTCDATVNDGGCCVSILPLDLPAPC